MLSIIINVPPSQPDQINKAWRNPKNKRHQRIKMAQTPILGEKMRTKLTILSSALIKAVLSLERSLLFVAAEENEVRMMWMVFLGALIASFNAYSAEKWNGLDEVTILAYSAPSPLSWETPGDLVRTTADNVLFGKIGYYTEEQSSNSWEHGSSTEQVFNIRSHPHPISHLNVRLACKNSEVMYMGMTSIDETKEDLNKVLFEGASLEQMITNVSGRFLSEKDILKWLPILEKKGLVHKLTFRLNPYTCRRLLFYLADYKTYRFDKIYGGLHSDALNGQGAGCASFGTSFIRAAGLYTEEFEREWKRELRIPKNLIGTEEQTAEVGFFGFVLWGHDGAWAKENEPHNKISFWDPELMFNWIQGVATGTKKFESYQYEVKTKHKSHEVIVKTGGYPTPITMVWESYDVIEKLRDLASGRSSQYFRDAARQGRAFHEDELPGLY